MVPSLLNCLHFCMHVQIYVSTCKRMSAYIKSSECASTSNRLASPLVKAPNLEFRTKRKRVRIPYVDRLGALTQCETLKRPLESGLYSTSVRLPVSMTLPECLTLIKKILIYEEFQNGAVAKSYMTDGLLIYGQIFSHFLIYQEALYHMTLQLSHSEFPYI